MKVHSVLNHKRGNDRGWHRRFRYCPYMSITLLFCIISLIGCGEQPANVGTDVTVEATAPRTREVSPTPSPTLPTITLQVVNCPSGLSLNWDKLIGTKPEVNKVQKVMCGSLEGYGTLEALVDVRYYSPDARLDYYVYDNLLGAPSLTFSMRGLLDGDAEISSVGTITTAEISSNDPLKGNQDLFKEYQWNGAAFVQVVFDGLYPDMTRYQAEKDEATVTAEIADGKTTDNWKLTGQGEVKRLAEYVFHWSNFSLGVVTNNKRQNITIIAATNLNPGAGGFIATLHHLNGDLNNIYEITQISPTDGNITLSSPAASERLTSPISVSGITLASSRVLGQVVVYDDMYTEVGDTGAIYSSTSGGYVQFSLPVNYHVNAQGAQEGVVAFYATDQNNFELSNQVVLVKVLLTA